MADLNRSRRFYCEGLGFEAVERGPGEIALVAGDSTQPILELVEETGLRPVPRAGRLGLFHVAILLPTRADLAAFVNHLLERGIRFGASDHLVSEAIYLSDPDGHGIEVYADRPREEWVCENQQLRMATLSLDFDSLRKESDKPWAGMPSGTCMGHVHLRVGSVPEARAFYHDLLGFDATVWDYPGALFMAVDGYHHHLAVNEWGRGLTPASNDEARLLEWTLEVPDQDDLRQLADVVAAGDHEARFEDGSLLLSDPWGTRLRVGVHSSKA